MNYILCEYTNKNEFDAGNKARSDVTAIANSIGYKHISLFRSGANKLVVCLQLVKGILNVLFVAKKNEDILLQYPYYPRLVNTLLFGLLKVGKKIKHYKLTIVIHDVVALRNENYSRSNGLNILTEELESLKIFDRIICHNKKMIKEFNKAGLKDNLIVLGPFDYLYDKQTIKIKNSGKIEIVIAGNLKEEKSGYIYKLPKLKNIQFNLYGIGYTGDNNAYTVYKGKYPPEELIEHLYGNYGLVWDGNSTKTCEGVFGQYLQYNNPHKLSLYIAAGLPLIIWSKAALAEFVMEENIGILINSLDELDEKLAEMSEDEYFEKVKNIRRVRERIIKGKNLTVALQEQP